MAVHKIEFSLNGRNRVTAQSIMDTIQQRLSDLSIEYSVVSRWPFRIELTESQYLLLCICWDCNTPYAEWKRVF